MSDEKTEQELAEERRVELLKKREEEAKALKNAPKYDGGPIPKVSKSK